MQLILPRLDRSLLTATSALVGAAALLLAFPAQSAFDPNAGANLPPTATTSSMGRLPDTTVLSDDAPIRPLYSPGRATPSTANTIPMAAGPTPTYVSPLEPIKMPRPLYPSRGNVTTAPAPMPAPVAVATPPSPMTTTTTTTTIAPLPGFSAPAPVAAAEPIVLTPPTVVATPAPRMTATPTMPDMPPVDEATQARAAAIMAAQNNASAAPMPLIQSDRGIQRTTTTTVATTAPAVVRAPVPMATAPMPQPVVTPTNTGSFIAPPPLLATAPVAASAPVPTRATVTTTRTTVATAPVPAPIQIPVPAAPPAPMVVAAAPASALSEQSRAVLAKVPSRMDSPIVQKSEAVKLERVSPQIQEVLGREAEEDSYEAVGLSIKMRRPGLDTNYELNNAYTALMGGDTTRAIDIYKNILGQDPKNEDAMFGLAATYHRLGMEEEARPFYAMLLKQNPNHREALNNFLVLVSNESPQDALPELERLELRNPDFSPIPAQIAIVYDKMGYPDQAREKMLRAIELAPENLTYKYNLAIMLDRQKHYADAVALYRLLIQAALNGEQVPASVDSMEKRLNYITTAAMQGRLG